MTISMIGQIQFRHVGGGGGADGAALSPGGGGLACLLMAAPCGAQYARYSVRVRQPDAPVRHMVSTLAAGDQETLRDEHGGAVEAAGFQVALRLVRVVERVRVHGDLQLVA